MGAYLVPLAIAFFSTSFLSLVVLKGKPKLIVKIKPELKDVQEKKAGTPSVGGIIFCVGTTVASIVTGASPVFLLSMWVFALAGLWDDILKTHTWNGDGLDPKAKFSLQILCAVISVMALSLNGEIDTVLFGRDWGWAYYCFAVLYLLFFVNAVNITDGLDGLAALVTFLPLLLLALIHQNKFLYAFIGSLLAFLIFNIKPARYFMGDTGSHALGAVLAVSALAEKSEVLILVSCTPLVIELLSSLLQIISIRTWGKRIFTIAPLHHAFEKRGMAEGAIVAVYALCSLVVSLLAFFIWYKGW